MRIQTSDFGAPPERMHVFARVISIRPETVRNTPPPLDPVLNTYMHGGQHYHRMVLRIIRWDDDGALAWLRSLQAAAWQSLREQTLFCDLPVCRHQLRQDIAHSQRRQIPTPDDGRWLVGCAIALDVWIRGGRWLTAHEDSVAPVPQLMQAYDYGLDKLGPCGRQMGII